MNSNEVYEALEHVKATSGKNDKVELLKRYLEDELFRYVVVQALDPRITFGVAKKTLDKVKSVGTAGCFNFDQVNINVSIFLQDLARREITGNAAIEQLNVFWKELDQRSFNVLTRILTKTLDIGATADSINKARPDTVWTFDCMLAHPYEAKRVLSWPVAAEPKLDGWRALAFIKQGVCEGFYSRTGKRFPAFDHLCEPLTALFAQLGDVEANGILDGEMTSGSFNETASAAGKKDKAATDAIFNVFDWIPMSVWDGKGNSAPYTQRRAAIIELLQLVTGDWVDPRFQVVPMELLYTPDQVSAYFDRQKALGLEGAIIKPLDHQYVRDRSYAWMKVKNLESHDVKIIGFEEGNGKYAGYMGTVITDWVNKKGENLKVGGGWSDADRAVMWTDQKAYIGRTIEIDAHEQTPDGSLRHPRFKRFRPDRDAVAA